MARKKKEPEADRLRKCANERARTAKLDDLIQMNLMFLPKQEHVQFISKEEGMRMLLKHILDTNPGAKSNYESDNNYRIRRTLHVDGESMTKWFPVGHSENNIKLARNELYSFKEHLNLSTSSDVDTKPAVTQQPQSIKQVQLLEYPTSSTPILQDLLKPTPSGGIEFKPNINHLQPQLPHPVLPYYPQPISQDFLNTHLSANIEFKPTVNLHQPQSINPVLPLYPQSIHNNSELRGYYQQPIWNFGTNNNFPANAGMLPPQDAYQKPINLDTIENKVLVLPNGKVLGIL